MRAVSYSALAMGLVLFGSLALSDYGTADHILFKTEQPHHILIEPATSPCNLVVEAVPSYVPYQE